MIPNRKDRKLFGAYEDAWPDLWTTDEVQSMIQNHKGWSLGRNSKFFKSKNNYKGLEFKINGTFSNIRSELDAYIKQNLLKELDIWICLHDINSNLGSTINLELSRISIEPQKIKISIKYSTNKYGEKVIDEIKILNDCKYKNNIETILSGVQYQYSFENRLSISSFENKLYISYCEEDCTKHYNNLIYKEYIRFSEMKKKQEIQLKIMENNIQLLENSFFNSDIVIETLERSSKNE